MTFLPVCHACVHFRLRCLLNPIRIIILPACIIFFIQQSHRADSATSRIITPSKQFHFTSSSGFIFSLPTLLGRECSLPTAHQVLYCKCQKQQPSQAQSIELWAHLGEVNYFIMRRRRHHSILLGSLLCIFCVGVYYWRSHGPEATGPSHTSNILKHAAST